MSDVLQISGAVMVLGAFALSQFHLLTSQSYPYLLLNVIGSGILAVLALIEHQWGFLLLEGGWACISLWSLLRPKGRAPLTVH